MKFVGRMGSNVTARTYTATHQLCFWETEELSRQCLECCGAARRYSNAFGMAMEAGAKSAACADAHHGDSPRTVSDHTRGASGVRRSSVIDWYGCTFSARRTF